MKNMGGWEAWGVYVTLCSNVRTTWRCSLRTYKVLFSWSPINGFSHAAPLTCSFMLFILWYRWLDLMHLFLVMFFFFLKLMLAPPGVVPTAHSLTESFFSMAQGEKTFKQSGCVTLYWSIAPPSGQQGEKSVRGFRYFNAPVQRLSPRIIQIPL